MCCLNADNFNVKKLSNAAELLIESYKQLDQRFHICIAELQIMNCIKVILLWEHNTLKQ